MSNIDIFMIIMSILSTLVLIILILIVSIVNKLPKISFCLPKVKADKPNEPYCICSECNRVIYEVNFYHCPKLNCLIQPKIEPKTLSERIVTKSDLQKLKEVK